MDIFTTSFKDRQKIVSNNEITISDYLAWIYFFHDSFVPLLAGAMGAM